MNKIRKTKKNCFEEFENSLMGEALILIMCVTFFPMWIYMIIRKIVTGKFPPNIPWKN